MAEAIEIQRVAGVALMTATGRIATTSHMLDDHAHRLAEAIATFDVVAARAKGA
ncbi:hypothetical protein D3C78_1760800 [compost metagenome]